MSIYSKTGITAEELIQDKQDEGLSQAEIQAYLEQTQQEAIDKAKADGMTVYVPDNHTITLDLDNPESERIHDEMKSLVEKLFHIQFKDSWTSKSGHKHVLYTTDITLTNETRIAIQACLGSDLKREILCLNRSVNHQTPNPSILFKPGVGK